jgi:metal-dependent amidase/aminoacylase/carboxypeptidase family protein
VFGHRGIEGNETADQLARIGSEHPFIVQPACDILTGAAKKVARNYMSRPQKVLGVHNRTQRCRQFGSLDPINMGASHTVTQNVVCTLGAPLF